MKLIKKDFIPSRVKSVCGRDLPSGKAFYIDTDNGVQYGSDDYVRKNFSNEERLATIDFTTSMIASFDRDVRVNTNNNSEELTNKQKNRDRYKAIVYMFLHEEKMPAFAFSKDNLFLTGVYNHYKEKNFLSNRQVEIILKIERDFREVISKEYRIKTLKNLLTCYAYEYKIKRALEVLDDDKKEYMNSMLENLYKNLYLTDNQVEGMFKWFQYLPKDLAEAKLKEFDRVE
ncbi:hypothetical protein [Francisella philomiragia]|uniref:hypothetical protein n=1 Tax=Francisella philomiragia TaxID=28110 RepID=UPI0019031E67|nr:hypothetical protein [Francisella philomiragia]MBK2266884.1 hypothetical protein [Francisella philomiragia]MBK2277948.1 hypothetical protein [Francisella philomiragia]MBK2285805.1 hypothetical protein [Francisella philomiragia]MBK2288167.1 hypothetical protein [Francisella philomiragia]MBK2289763.1 hypothetical protein [Francisella philomiragia]